MPFSLQPFIPLANTDLLGLENEDLFQRIFEAVKNGDLLAVRRLWDWRLANEPDGEGKTLLMHAAEGAHREIVEFLLQQRRIVFIGRDLEDRITYFSDPREAQRRLLLGHRVRRILKPAVDANLKDRRGRSAWDYAVKSDCADIIAALRNPLPCNV